MQGKNSNLHAYSQMVITLQFTCWFIHTFWCSCQFFGWCFSNAMLQNVIYMVLAQKSFAQNYESSIEKCRRLFFLTETHFGSKEKKVIINIPSAMVQLNFTFAHSQYCSNVDWNWNCNNIPFGSIYARIRHREK